MGPDNESKGKEEASTEGLRCMDDKNGNCPLQSAIKMNDTEAPSVEQTIMLDASEDVELDMAGRTNNCDWGSKSEGNVSTENSSSFGDTLSGTDYGSLSGDEEVRSQLYGGNRFETMSTRHREIFPRRKKKVTDHWRRFSSHVSWRCRWAELRIKELQLQLLKYDREIALCDQRKQSEYENISMEGFDVKSLGFSGHVQRHGAMKRKKRKKIEETIDIASYMADHSLFSYYEKKRSLADNMALEDNFLKLDKTKIRHHDIDDFGTRTTEGWAFCTLGDNDNILEDIFTKIEAAQSKLHNLKNRIDKVVTENPMKFPSIDRLNFLTSSDDPASPEDGNEILVRSLHEASRHISEHEFGDVLIPESAVRSHGDVVLLPEMIESTDKTPIGLSCGSPQKVLIQNSAVKEELHFSEDVKCQFIEQPQILEDQKLVSPAAVSQADFTLNNTEPIAQPIGKSLSVVKSNLSKRGRRQGRRKTGSRKRKRRATG